MGAVRMRAPACPAAPRSAAATQLWAELRARLPSAAPFAPARGWDQNTAGVLTRAEKTRLRIRCVDIRPALQQHRSRVDAVVQRRPLQWKIALAKAPASRFRGSFHKKTVSLRSVGPRPHPFVSLVCKRWIGL